MSTPIAIASDLGTYLGDPNIDTVRATLVLQLAQDLCETVWSPLGVTALGTLLAVAARAFSNVTSANNVAIGTGHIGYGAPGASMGVGGLYLSRSDQRTLRLLAGRGGAFSIDPTPADAGQGLMPWDQNVTWLEGVPLAEDQGRQ
jgi:hypothetical protein